MKVTNILAIGCGAAFIAYHLILKKKLFCSQTELSEELMNDFVGVTDEFAKKNTKNFESSELDREHVDSDRDKLDRSVPTDDYRLSKTEVYESREEAEKDIEGVLQTVDESSSLVTIASFNKFVNDIKHTEKYEIIKYEKNSVDPKNDFKIRYILMYAKWLKAWHWIVTEEDRSSERSEFLCTIQRSKILTNEDRNSIPANTINGLMVSCELGCFTNNAIVRIYDTDSDSKRNEDASFYDVKITVDNK